MRLMSAAFHGHHAAVARLLRRNSVSECFTEGRNLNHLVRVAFFLAVENQRMKVLGLFLDHRVNIDTRDYHGRTTLHRATARQNAAMVELLLDRGAMVDARDQWQNTPWILAAKSQSRESG